MLDLPQVEHVVVHRRGARPGDAPFAFESEREHDFYGIQNPREIHCPPAIVDAERGRPTTPPPTSPGRSASASAST